MNYNRALLQAHVAVMFMGAAGVLAYASGFEPWRATAYRVTFGSVVLLLIWFFATDRKWPKTARTLEFLALGVVLGVHWFAFFKSINLLGVMMGSAMIGLEPLIIALAASVFLGESLSRRTWISMGLAGIGFVILGFAGGLKNETFVEGTIWAVFSYCLFAILVLANRVRVKKESALLITALEMLGAVPISLIMMQEPFLPENGISWVYALSLGLLCTGLAYAFYNNSMKVLSAPVAGVLLSLEVVYGILGGRMIGDTLSGHELIAVLFISNILFLDIANYFINRKKTKALREEGAGT